VGVVGGHRVDELRDDGGGVDRPAHLFHAMPRSKRSSDYPVPDRHA
jgi:hypothetical protein